MVQQQPQQQQQQQLHHFLWVGWWIFIVWIFYRSEKMCGCVFIGWVGMEVSIWVIASRHAETDPHVLYKSTVIIKWETMQVKTFGWVFFGKSWCYVMSRYCWHIKLPCYYVFSDLYRPTVLNLPQLTKNNATFKSFFANQNKEMQKTGFFFFSINCLLKKNVSLRLVFLTFGHIYLPVITLN